MKNKETYSKYVALCSNCVRVDMDVFTMPESSILKFKCKLFCDKIKNIYQSLFKDKRVITH